MNTWRIVLDGRELAYLNVGNYVAKEIDSGEHLLASSIPTSFNAKAGGAYFFSYEPLSFGGADYIPLKDAEALDMTAEFARVKPLY